MDRRHFLQLSASGAVALLTPLTACSPLSNGGTNAKPAQLFLGKDAHLAFDRDGRGLVVEPFLNRVSWMGDTGVPTSLVGDFGLEPGQFNNPIAAAFDRDGRMYVLDRGNHRVQLFGLPGRLERVLGGYGSDADKLANPSALAFNSFGQLYIADAHNHRLSVWDGDRPLKTVAEGALNGPVSLAFWPDNSLWVLDAAEQRIVQFDANGTQTGTIALTGQRLLRAIAIGGDGRAFVADLGSRSVMVFDQMGRHLEDRALGANVRVLQLAVDGQGDVYAATEAV